MSLPKVILEEISAKISEVIESNPAKDIEKNIKSIISSFLNRADIITREEFDIQQKMVKKMAIVMAELEKRIETLEHQDKKPAPTATKPNRAKNRILADEKSSNYL